MLRANLHHPQFTSSRLETYRGELLRLHHTHNSIVDLQYWLAERGIFVAHASVSRWLEQVSGHTL